MHRNRARDAEQPLLRHHAGSSKPRRVHVQRVRRMRMRVREVPDPWDVMRCRGDIEQRSL